MIVNYLPEGWEIITQRAHGLLAAQLGYHWKFDYPGGRCLETLVAIADHDDTGVEFDPKQLLTKAGGPVHFAMQGFKPDHCRQLLIESQAKSRYLALLNTMHLLFLYGKEQGASAKPFLTELRRFAANLRRQVHVSKAEIERTYALFQWCDALSLLICQHSLQPEQRWTEISKGPDGVSYEICMLSADELSVQPWPFREPKFMVSVEARTLARLRYRSSAAFLRALEKAPFKEFRYWLSKG
ncbi:MAG TPA: DUF3891 family protein [Puia sp.]|nr:DUF3891 family protein [Puia sp.]